MSRGFAVAGGTRRDLPPLEFTLPRWDRVVPRKPRSRRVGVPLGLAMYAAALWLSVENDTFRRFEAFIVTPVASFLTGRHGAVTSNTIVYFALGTRRAFGIDITNECTSALLLIPLLLMIGSFAIFTRLSLRRQLLALTAGAVLILTVNVIRVAGIAWATWRFGYDPGYTYSHVFVGSAFSLIGFVGAMLVALWVLVRTDRKHAAAAVRSATPIAITAGPRTGMQHEPPPVARAATAPLHRPRPGPGVAGAAPVGVRRPRPGPAAAAGAPPAPPAQQAIGRHRSSERARRAGGTSVMHAVDYVVLGDRDQTLVLLHGVYEDVSRWDRVLPSLDDSYRVIAICLPSLGRGEPPRRHRLPAAGNVNAVQAVLDAEGVTGPVTLIGARKGAVVSALFAARHPRRIDRMVLIDMPGLRGVEGLWRRAASRSGEVTAWRGAPHGGRAGRASVSRTWLANVRASRFGSLLADVGVPVLLLDSSRDLLSPTAVLRQVGRAGGAVVMAGCANSAQVDRPEVLLSHVMPFLDDPRASAAG